MKYLVANIVLCIVCLLYIAFHVGTRYEQTEIADRCEHLGLIKISGKAYTCDPVPPKTWKESEDFK